MEVRPEFREGAVRIVRETGKPIAQAARDRDPRGHARELGGQGPHRAGREGGAREPNAKSSAKAADIELARLIVEAESQRVLPSSGVTVRQIMERWVEHRRPGWGERSPGQPDATLARIRNHITVKLGDVALDHLHSQSRSG